MTVNNTGNQATGQLTVGLSGANTASFALSGTTITSIAVGGSTAFTVRPATGLAVGTHSATVTVSGGNGITASFNVSFTVTPAPVYSISLSQTTAHVFTPALFGYAAAPDALSVTVNNTGNQATGQLTVGLSDANAASFTLSATTITSIAAGGNAAFTVRPNTGLAGGTHNATVTVSGGNGITASFDVSFTVAANLVWTAIEGGTGYYEDGGMSYIITDPGPSTFRMDDIYSIAWGGPAGNERFVAVGTYGRMAYSADGISWTAIEGGTGTATVTDPGPSTFGQNTIFSIAWGGPAGNERFVAVGNSGRMAYSTDGINWTAIEGGTGTGSTVTDPGPSTFGSINIRSIAWGGPAGNERFVAVGYTGRMAYSADGTNWTAINNTASTFGSINIRSIAWGGPAGNQRFVAGGNNGRMAYSADGISWTAINATASTFGTTNGIVGIAWGGSAGNERFVAVGGGGRMAYSANGISWTAINATASTFVEGYYINGIAWGGPAGRFIAVGDWDGRMAYSADGINWTAIEGGTGYVGDWGLSWIITDPGPSTFGGSRINSIAWGGPVGRFVAVGDWGRMAYSSFE
ncbi:MAG: hypothetical protein FWG89_05845 [Treponema sp.]|nr:hypothetical protein [Treponema sp.]